MSPASHKDSCRASWISLLPSHAVPTIPSVTWREPEHLRGLHTRHPLCLHRYLSVTGAVFPQRNPLVSVLPVHRARVSHLHVSLPCSVNHALGFVFHLTVWLWYNSWCLYWNGYLEDGVDYLLQAPYEQGYVMLNIVLRFPSMMCYVCAWFYYSQVIFLSCIPNYYYALMHN